MVDHYTVEILLVEDNPDDVELTLHAFKKSKLVNRVQVVRDGAEALDYLFGDGEFAGRDVLDVPHLVLLDLKLPKVSGIEVLRRIRGDPRTRSIPVVAMTSSREERDIAETYKLGLNSYIVKPVDFDQFGKIVEELGYYWLLLNQPPTRPAPGAGHTSPSELRRSRRTWRKGITMRGDPTEAPPSSSPSGGAIPMLDHYTVEILLVEDNPDDVELTLHAFKKSKLVNRVRVVRDGAEALDYLFGDGEFAGRDVLDVPHLVLLDLKLPKVSGIEVLRRIRGDPRTRSIPVVAMTSSREERDIAETYKLGINSYIVKPVDFDQFGKVVEQLGYYWLLLNQPPLPPEPEPRT